MKTVSRLNPTLFVALAAFGSYFAANPALAAVTFTGVALTQDFDSLANTGSTQAWTNDSTLAGWSLFCQPTPATALTSINVGTGSNNAGAFYSFGVGGTNIFSERALGGVGSNGAYYGTPATTVNNPSGWIAFAVTNGTANTISSITAKYDGEQWRDGGAVTPAAQTMTLEYGFGSTFQSVTTWIAPGSSFNFTSPIFINTGSGNALDGNAPANRIAGIGGAINSLTWNSGDTLWIRWIEINDPAGDHALAIDNFSFSAALAGAVPEASTICSLSGLLSIYGLVVVRRNRRADA